MKKIEFKFNKTSIRIIFIKPTMMLLLLLFIFGNELKAQIALKTNLVIPITHFIDEKLFGSGFDISMEKKVFTKNTLRISAHHHNQILSNAMPNRNALSSSTLADFFYKNGVRIGFKHYFIEREADLIPYGFYCGIFTDIMYARRKITQRIYEQGLGYSEKEIFESKGMLWSAGINTGYTFKFNRLIIEPNFGMGKYINPKKFEPGKEHGFSNEKDVDLGFDFSPFHLELNVGWTL